MKKSIYITKRINNNVYVNNTGSFYTKNGYGIFNTRTNCFINLDTDNHKTKHLAPYTPIGGKATCDLIIDSIHKGTQSTNNFIDVKHLTTANYLPF